VNKNVWIVRAPSEQLSGQIYFLSSFRPLHTVISQIPPNLFPYLPKNVKRAQTSGELRCRQICFLPLVEVICDH
jgi:hypothetical protein